MESSNPAMAAVAAPIRKLCPAYWDWSSPRSCRIRLTRPTNQALTTTSLLGCRKKALLREPLTSRYLTIAATGQSSSPVRPTTTSVPAPNWSHLDLLRWTWTIVGLSLWSTATSPQVRQLASLKAPVESGSNSPSRKKPKNAVLAIAQTTCLAKSSEASRAHLIRLRRWDVMGNRTLVGVPRRDRM